VGQASSFSALFDQYRIDAVRFSIVPQNNAVGMLAPSNIAVVPIYCVIDYDDATALISAGDANKYDNTIILEPGESLARTFSPRMAAAVYSGAFTSFANIGPEWIDVGSSGVLHYGVKLWIPAVVAAQTTLQTWSVQVEYFLSFRSLR
jgi:hypothetical protein